MKDTEIKSQTTRVEQIIETLERGDISLEEASSLREEAHSLLEDLDEELIVGDGEVAVLNDE